MKDALTILAILAGLVTIGVVIGGPFTSYLMGLNDRDYKRANIFIFIFLIVGVIGIYFALKTL